MYESVIAFRTHLAGTEVSKIHGFTLMQTELVSKGLILTSLRVEQIGSNFSETVTQKCKTSESKIKMLQFIVW